MSAVPIFKLPKIKHENTKARKDFILDCLFVGVGISCLYVSLYEDMKEGVKTLHKNKHRKNVKKIETVYNELKEKQLFLYDRMTLEDRKTVDHKNQDKIAKAFIRTIALVKQEISLEYVAISVLEQGLRRKRKTKLYQELMPFCDFRTLYEGIGKNVELLGNMDFEWELANKFVREVRY